MKSGKNRGWNRKPLTDEKKQKRKVALKKQKKQELVPKRLRAFEDQNIEPRWHQILTKQFILSNHLPDPTLSLYPQTQTPTTFDLFPKLSIEIRLKIWKMSRGRVIEAFIDNHGNLRSQTRAPVGFRVCRESRTELLKLYKQPYHAPKYPTPTRQPALHQHFFDPEVDTVYMSLGRKTNVLGKGEDLSIIQNLIIDTLKDDWFISMLIDFPREQRYKWAFEAYNNERLQKLAVFKGLKDLIILSRYHYKRFGVKDDQVKDVVDGVTWYFDRFKENNDAEGSVPEVRVAWKCRGRWLFNSKGKRNDKRMKDSPVWDEFKKRGDGGEDGPKLLVEVPEKLVVDATDVDKEEENGTVKAMKLFPFGYGPAIEGRIVIEEVAEHDEDEEPFENTLESRSHILDARARAKGLGGLELDEETDGEDDENMGGMQENENTMKGLPTELRFKVMAEWRAELFNWMPPSFS